VQIRDSFTVQKIIYIVLGWEVWPMRIIRGIQDVRIIGESVCFAVYKSGKDSPIDICSITNYFDKYSALITHFKK
jgi:hypothetical protein